MIKYACSKFNSAAIPLLVLVVFCISVTITRAGWILQESGTQATLKAISAVDENKAIAAGEGGTILITTDGGVNWQTVTFSSPFELTSLQMVSPLIGYIAGQGGTILKSTNGGESWFSVAPANLSNNFYAIKFHDEQTGFVAGSDGLLLKTTNGGTDWIVIPIATSKALRSISISPAGKVFIAGGSFDQPGPIIIMGTLNGVSWQIQEFVSDNILTAIHCTGENMIYAGGEGGLLMTSTDGGSNWYRYSSSTYSYYAIDFLNTQTGFIAGGNIQNGVVLEFTSGLLMGMVNPIFSQWIYGLDFYSKTAAWLCGYNGRIYRFIRYTLSWNNISPGIAYRINTLLSVSESVMFAAGDSGKILKTTDRGYTWAEQITGTISEIHSLASADNQTFWAVGTGGSLLKASGDSNVWHPQSSPLSTRLLSVHFYNNRRGMAVGDSGKIISTTNGGNSWIARPFQQRKTLRAVYIVDSLTAYCAGSDDNNTTGAILKTTTGGFLWLVVYGVDNPFTGLHFLNNNFGVAVGANGFVSITFDGGTNWKFSRPTNYQLYNVKILPGNIIVAVGGSETRGVVLVSADYGASWDSFIIPGASSLYSISFPDSTKGYVSGEHGKIFEIQLMPEVVPVELSSYAASDNGEQAILNWSTVSEKNNLGFEIQRDGLPVGFVSGSGTTTGPVQYRYAEKPGAYGTFDYTVVQVDYDGARNELFSLKVTLTAPAVDNLMQNYPNPFNPETTIEYSIESAGMVRLELYDITGTLLEVLIREEKLPGSYSYNLNMSKYSGGNYFYRLIHNQKVMTGKLTYLK